MSRDSDPATRRRRGAAAKDALVIRGVAISSADRVMYPDAGLTKLDLVRYVDTVADWLLPHVADRPLSLLYCPGGISCACVYLKHGKGPAVLRRVMIREKTKVGEYMVADSPDALVAIMQMNWVEVHTWNSCASSLEQPNRVVIDLDPGPDVGWPQEATIAETSAARSRTIKKARGTANKTAAGLILPTSEAAAQNFAEAIHVPQESLASANWP